ncbi:isoleucine--tRNA ligase [Patescibacteria group bacterium]|nr:isoleucine--tRNA ligase [Patescibacteria group bacterium]
MEKNKENSNKTENSSNKEQKSPVALREEAILKFWEENKIFEKSVEQRSGLKEFIFFEGPPTANGKPGIHHVLARSFKDIICRYKTMRGFKVERKAGWDTHGLPVELQVEKELKISSKPEIEKYGIEEFNKKCKASVWEYKDEWEKLTTRIGYWLDLKNPYVTYSNEYIESVWWILSEIYKKGLLYEGHKVVPYCSRCGTGLSSHEVAQGYKKIKDTSVYVKFKAKSGQKIGDFITDDNTYFLVWTTTPWTLPGNVALAVGKDIEYVIISYAFCNSLSAGIGGGENVKKNISFAAPINTYYILAKERLDDILKDQFCEMEGEFKGKDLLGLEYEQLFDFVKPSKPAFRVVAGDFVTTQDGSGIVHIAPAFGEDDMNAAKENNLPVLMTVNLQGKFIDEIIPWAGKYVAREETNEEIIAELDKRKVLFKTEEIEHDYPFCWRCGTKLIYYAKKSWFIKISDPKIKKALIENNEKINWMPEHIKDGRMGEWLREIKDWALSRERYWGTPLPIWKCQIGKVQSSKFKVQSCGNIKIIGSVKELEELSGKKLEDLHRPYIDEVIFKCDKCDGEMKRVSDVIDCWFDSGSMPFSQWHYPFENKELVDEGGKFPADYISEAIDQTRGWFYTLLAISTLLGKSAPYKNVITYGHILDAKGQKMSKSKGNVVNPWEMADKYGIDVLRWYFYTVGGPGEPKRFDFKDLNEAQNKFYRTFWNSYLFFQTYASKVEKIPLTPFAKGEAGGFGAMSLSLLDKWIVSRLNETILEATKLLDKYDIIRSARLIGDFTDDLSNWYIRRSRDRMRGENSAAAQTLGFVLREMTKLTAPFVPFVSEEIYRNIRSDGDPESAHLLDWPKADEKLIDRRINEKMDIVRDVVALGLAIRAKNKLKVRQPLKKLKVKSEKLKVSDELLELIKDELNIKEVLFVGELKEENGWVLETDGKITIVLDIEITDELKEEGIVRDIARHIQTMRKDLGLVKEDLIEVYVEKLGNIEKIFTDAKWEKFIKEKTIAKNIADFKAGEKYDLEKDLEMEGMKVRFGIRKI